MPSEILGTIGVLRLRRPNAGRRRSEWQHERARWQLQNTCFSWGL